MEQQGDDRTVDQAAALEAAAGAARAAAGGEDGATSVRGPKHVVTKGATPVLTAAETRALLDRIDTGTRVGLRDRALLSVMVYSSFARVSTAVGMRRQDYFRQELRGWLRLHEKGREAARRAGAPPRSDEVLPPERTR